MEHVRTQDIQRVRGFEQNKSPLPDPIHPGRVLKSLLQENKISTERLAIDLKVSVNLLSGILSGIRNISAETALRLGRYFSTDAQFWMNLQGQYELAKAQKKIGKSIIAEVELGGADISDKDWRLRQKTSSI